MWKKMRPKSVVLQSQKKLKILEKISFEKEFLPAYLCRYDVPEELELLEYAMVITFFKENC